MVSTVTPTPLAVMTAQGFHAPFTGDEIGGDDEQILLRFAEGFEQLVGNGRFFAAA